MWQLTSGTSTKNTGNVHYPQKHAFCSGNGHSYYDITFNGKEERVGEGEIWKCGRGLVPIEANCISDDVPVKLIYDVTVNPLYPITPSQFNTDL